LTTVASMMLRNIADANTVMTTSFGGSATFTDYYKMPPGGRVPLLAETTYGDLG